MACGDEQVVTKEKGIHDRRTFERSSIRLTAMKAALSELDKTIEDQEAKDYLLGLMKTGLATLNNS